MAQRVKNLPAIWETQFDFGSGRSPGEGNGNSRQYSCLESPMDRGVWQAIVHGVAKNSTWLWVTNTFTFSRFIHKLVYILILSGTDMYGWESWTVKKAECRWIDAFALWCWRGDQEMGIFACSLWSNLRWIEHQELLLVCCHTWANEYNSCWSSEPGLSKEVTSEQKAHKPGYQTCAQSVWGRY